MSASPTFEEACVLTRINFRTTTAHNQNQMPEFQKRELPSVPDLQQPLAKPPAGFTEHDLKKQDSPKYSHVENRTSSSKRKTISLSEEKDTRRSSRGIVSFKKTSSRKFSRSEDEDSGMGRTASYPEYDKEGKRVRPAAYRPSLRF